MCGVDERVDVHQIARVGEESCQCVVNTVAYPINNQCLARKSVVPKGIHQKQDVLLNVGGMHFLGRHFDHSPLKFEHV